jgi:WD40 repeat protein
VWAGFSPDGHRVLTASDDGTAQLWDARSGLPIGAALRHDGPVAAASFSADGAIVVTSSRNLTRTWDARTGGVAETRLRHAEGLLVTVAALSADGALVATAGSLDSNLPPAEREHRAEEEHVVQIWDAATGQALGGPLRHGGPIRSLRFDSAGASRLVTASADGTARIWDARTATLIGAALQHRGPVHSAGFSVDGSRVLTASADGTARVWDASSGRPLAEFSHCDGGQCAEVRSAAFNPDATRVVTGASDGNARLWNVATGALIETLSSACDETELAGEKAPVASVSYSTDGTRLLTSSDRASLVRDGESLAAIVPCVSHEGARNLPVFSRNRPGDGLQLVTTSTIDAARVWDVSPELVARWELPRDRGVLAAAFSGDGRLVTAAQDGSARIWNVRTGQETGLVLHHGTELGWTTFSSDGSRILTLAADGIARLWDVPSGSREDAEALARLADAVSGHTLDAAGVHRLDKAEAQAAVRERAATPPSAGSFADTFERWLFADPATREISPLSRVTVPDDKARVRALPGAR